jgi:hypothetical protein
MLVENGRETGYLALSDLELLYKVIRITSATDQTTDKFLFRKRHPQSPELLAIYLATKICHQDDDLEYNGGQPHRRSLVAEYPIWRTANESEYIVHINPLLDRVMANQSNYVAAFEYACSAYTHFLMSTLESRRDQRRFDR